MKDHSSTEFGSIFENTKKIDNQLLDEKEYHGPECSDCDCQMYEEEGKEGFICPKCGKVEEVKTNEETSARWIMHATEKGRCATCGKMKTTPAETGAEDYPAEYYKKLRCTCDEAKISEEYSEEYSMEKDVSSGIDAYAEAGIMEDIKDTILEAIDELSIEGFNREEVGNWIIGQVQDIVDRGSTRR